MDTSDVVNSFVAAINSGHAERIRPLMSRGHVFIDSLARRTEGQAEMMEAWRAYFRLFPDYRIDVDGLMVDGQAALLHGRASGTLHRDGRPVEGGHWEIPAAWRAESDGKRIQLWQVYADNHSVRELTPG